MEEDWSRHLHLNSTEGTGWPPWKKLPIFRDFLRKLPDSLICDFVLFIDSSLDLLRLSQWAQVMML